MKLQQATHRQLRYNPRLPKQERQRDDRLSQDRLVISPQNSFARNCVLKRLEHSYLRRIDWSTENQTDVLLNSEDEFLICTVDICGISQGS